jgi:hypothetical protein
LEREALGEEEALDEEEVLGEEEGASDEGAFEELSNDDVSSSSPAMA